MYHTLCIHKSILHAVNTRSPSQIYTTRWRKRFSIQL